MPFVISPRISLGTQGEWHEGSAYTKENLYTLTKEGLPPVNYDAHTLKPHSLSHIESPLHTQKAGRSIDKFFEQDLSHFFGKCIVLKFKNENWIEHDNKLKQKIITRQDLVAKLKNYANREKVLITVEGIPKNKFGFHDPNFILTLSLEAAEYLTSLDRFNLFGTSWKSSDYEPGSSKRPIHNEIFKKALILEYVDLSMVPEGEYFINCFPLNLKGASESPVTAVLFGMDELG